MAHLEMGLTSVTGAGDQRMSSGTQFHEGRAPLPAAGTMLTRPGESVQFQAGTQAYRERLAGQYRLALMPAGQHRLALKPAGKVWHVSTDWHSYLQVRDRLGDFRCTCHL